MLVLVLAVVVLMVEEGGRWWGQTSGLIMVPGPLPSTGQPSICQSTHQPIPQILTNTHPIYFPPSKQGHFGTRIRSVTVGMSCIYTVEASVVTHHCDPQTTFYELQYKLLKSFNWSSNKM